MTDYFTKGNKIVQNLEDAGCSPQNIEQCCHCYEEGSVEELLRLLSGHRKFLLEQIHENQKKLDCLDYLIYKIRKGVK
ncbi:hypothetical protein NE619_07180 [Anaerovorax odorimutans]|uniref:Uncharacterized protein n=1 Tax=Anaerovorax odorimutans TaxID=109327 RepID=A0ABT1RMV2_9FIRM|nr:hypothetical protein [Anaerovorax odorimutans]MCQ4636507.1 hypothetical protein [Anaerovorax odorimutans]